MHNVDVKHLAKLARIEITDEEAAQYEKEFAAILEYTQQVNEVAGDETGRIESASVRNVLREDTDAETPGTHTDALLEEAPKTRDGYVEVQKILDTSSEG